MHSVDQKSDIDVEELIRGTGCLDKHHAVQECIAETKDWRKCQEVVQNFRKCIEEGKKSDQNFVKN